MEETNTKEVYYWKWCSTCAHKDKKESEDPCWDCLNEPVNAESHKPVKWERK